MMSGLHAMLSAFLLSNAGAALLPTFDSFIQTQGRSYVNGSAEYLKRQTLYETVKASAELHNRRSDRLWSAGVSSLWDWTEAELQKLRGWDGSLRPQGGQARTIHPHSTFLQQKSEPSTKLSELPKQKMWTNLAMARHVKNQGACGSCWAIAAATVLEAHTEIYTGHARTFSAQQIVSCTPNPRSCGGDGGCQGATAELAMDWVLHHGCAEESSVPYRGQDEECTVKADLEMAQMFSDGDAAPSGAAAFGMTGWETLPKNKYAPLVRSLAERGPVAVSVAADTWQMYGSGIFNNCEKDAIIDHAVTAIGYGEENGIKYWEIQNSWGSGWGESGHIRLQRHDADEYCGMNTKPQLGVACKGENDPVPVCGMCGVLFDSVVPHFKSRSPQ